ncbi:hypothetical protein BY996DRAFT_6410065 [Phakopsora pachyrhizi]|nr:hypothetical protein BY996DRAFT_6410065 [Phakopsora pachyrhizi]
MLEKLSTVSLGEVESLKRDSRIDLSLTLGPSAKKLKPNYSPISSFTTLDPDFLDVDIGVKGSDGANEIGLSLKRDNARYRPDLELKLASPAISQNLQPEKLSLTTLNHNQQELQSSVLPGPHRTQPTSFPLFFPGENENFNPVHPIYFNYDSIRESTLRGSNESGSSKQSNFHLAQNAEISNRITKNPNFSSAANLPIAQVFSPQFLQDFYNSPQYNALIQSISNNVVYGLSTSSGAETSSKLLGALNFAKDEKIRRELSNNQQATQKKTSQGTQRNLINSEKENSDENFNQKVLKGKDSLKDDKIHLKSNSRKKIKIRASKANLSTKNLESSAMNGVSTLETLEDPYKNVLKLDDKRIFLIELLLTTVEKPNLSLRMPREKAIFNSVISYPEHFEEFGKYFENLKIKWIEEWKNIYKKDLTTDKLINNTNRIANYLNFATVYTNQRIGLLNKENGLEIFADTAVAKKEAWEVLQNCWDLIPVAQNLSIKGNLEKTVERKMTHKDGVIQDQKKIKLYNFILNFRLKKSQTLCFSSKVLKYTLQNLLPQNYHSIFLIDDNQKKPLNFGLIRKLNDISLEL